MQPWFEFAPQLSGEYMNFDNQSWCTLNNYTTTGGAEKMARYRYNYEMRRTPDSDNDYTNVYLADSGGQFLWQPELRGQPGKHGEHGKLDAGLCGQPRRRQLGFLWRAKRAKPIWLHRHAGHEVFVDDVGFQHCDWRQPKFFLGARTEFVDHGRFTILIMIDIYNTPVFLRMYWRALQELVNGPLNVANSGPLIEAKYNVFTENGFSVENPAANIEPWLSQAQSSIASQLAAVNATSFPVNPSFTVSNNVAYLTGVAPVNVDTILDQRRGLSVDVDDADELDGDRAVDQRNQST